jgi:adiponectin receptor
MANYRLYDRLANLDYVGIVGLVVGSCVPVAWFGFGGEHHLLRSLYLGAIALTGAAVIVGSLSGVLSKLSEAARISLFALIALAGVAALLHAAYVHELSERHVALIHGVAKMGLTYGLGVVFYASKFPESVAPRCFDRVGSSHQVWHACVLLAAWYHFQTLWTLWQQTAILVAESTAVAGLPNEALREANVVTPPIASSSNALSVEL